MSFSLSGVKAWYKSLGVWGGAGTILVAVAGFLHITTSAGDAAAVDNWVQALLLVITGVMSLYGRLRATKAIGTPAAGSSNGTPRSLLLALVCSMALLGSAGCQGTSSAPATQPSLTQRLTQVERGYRLALTTLADARDAGLLTQAQLDAIKPERKLIDDALARAEAAGADATAASAALDAAEGALGDLQPILNQIK